MREYKDLYCKLFIDFNGSRNELVDKLTQIVNGNRKRIRSIESPIGEIDVNNNEDYNEERSFIEDDGFLYSKYYLDIEPFDDIKQSEYISWMKKLVKNLIELNYNVVVASDFEDELK